MGKVLQLRVIKNNDCDIVLERLNYIINLLETTECFYMEACYRHLVEAKMWYEQAQGTVKESKDVGRSEDTNE